MKSQRDQRPRRAGAKNIADFGTVHVRFNQSLQKTSLIDFMVAAGAAFISNEIAAPTQI